MNAFLILLAAIASEIVATSALKVSDGFSKLGPSLIVVAGYSLAFYLLSLTLRTMSVGVSYAIWAGLGTVGVALIGVFYFGESMNLMRAGGIATIVIGVVMLHIGSFETVQ